METRTIDYVVQVLGTDVEGHPIQRITNNFKDASTLHDLFRLQYPNKTIVILHTVQRVIVKTVPEKKEAAIPKCPKGHSGLVDGKNIIKETSAGFYCSVCGDIFTNVPAQ